jgi:hypothetical protein
MGFLSRLAIASRGSPERFPISGTTQLGVYEGEVKEQMTLSLGI